MRPIYKYLIFFLLLPIIFAAGFWFFVGQNAVTPNTEAATANIQPISATPPPDLSMLAMQRNQSLAEPSPEQLQEQQKIEAEQVASANQMLFDTDIEQRKTAIEQLGAYPTAEAEKLLQESLQGDVSPEVRAAAATSLGYFKQPAPETLTALLLALQDEESVSQHAFDSLNKFLQQLPIDSSGYRYLAIELKKALHEKLLPESVRDNLEHLLEEQNIK